MIQTILQKVRRRKWYCKKGKPVGPKIIARKTVPLESNGNTTTTQNNYENTASKNNSKPTLLPQLAHNFHQKDERINEVLI